MFKNPFSLNGRIRRLEYGLSYIIFVAIAILISIVSGLSDSLSYFAILFIPLIWFLVAQNTKRCHDRGNSGFYQLIPFYKMILLFGESDYGTNEYGPNPKGVGNYEEINHIGDYLTNE